MPIQTWPRQGEWTVERMWELVPDDGNRYEVIDGVLYVTPSPTFDHQDVIGRLYLGITTYLERWRVGCARMAPADVRFAPDRGVQPDLYVSPLVDGRRPRTWQQIRHLLLAVEVLSPSTASYDRGVKRRLYQQHADELWIVDLFQRRIERWRPGLAQAEVLDRVIEWRPAGAEEPLALDIPALFREALDT